jgi:hypothetical protein
MLEGDACRSLLHSSGGPRGGGWRDDRYSGAQHMCVCTHVSEGKKGLSDNHFTISWIITEGHRHNHILKQKRICSHTLTRVPIGQLLRQQMCLCLLILRCKFHLCRFSTMTVGTEQLPTHGHTKVCAYGGYISTSSAPTRQRFNCH